MHDSIDEEGGRAPYLTRRYPALDIATNPSQYGGADPIDVERRHVQLELGGVSAKVLICEGVLVVEDNSCISQNRS